MSRIDDLRRRFAINLGEHSEVHFGEMDQIEEQVRLTREWVGGGSGLEQVTDDRLLAALSHFYQTGEIRSKRDQLAIAFGCTSIKGRRTRALIEDKERFAILLSLMEAKTADIRRFKRYYRGLLNAYLSFDPEESTELEVARGNWEALRRFLLRYKPAVIGDPGSAEWIPALADHEGILTQKPCAKYGLAALNGDRSDFEDLRRRLDVRADSWLIKRLVLAQVEAAVELNDNRFRPTIDHLLPLLEEHEPVLNDGLAQLINRYSRSSSLDPAQGLMNASVHHWGNPWIPSNFPKWGGVTDKARDMVATWLKLRMISHFFSLMSEDGANDKRRLNFWRAYHEKIEDMYFVLGGDAMKNRSRDFKEMRLGMAGRLAQLYAAGPPSNNAFIMMIGDYAVVEFGSKGNAAYIFNRRQKLPFALSGHIAGNNSELKNQDTTAFVERLVHNDTNDGPWESRFERVLKKRVGASASTPPPARRVAPAVTATRQAAVTSPMNDAALADFCMTFGFQMEDRRTAGGRLWLFPRRSVTPVDARETLSKWKFRWSDKKAGYYLEG